MNKLVLILVAVLSITSILCCQEEHKKVAALLTEINDKLPANTDSVKVLFQQLFEQVDTTQIDSIAWASLYNFAIYNYSINNFTHAESLAKRSLKLSEKLSDLERAKSNSILSVCYFEASLFEESIQSALQAEYYFIKMNQLSELGKIYSSLAITYSEIGQLTKAIPFFKKAAESHQKENREYDYILTLQNLGYAYARTEKFDTALQVQNRAMKLSSSTNDTTNMAYGSGYIGSIYHKKNKLDSARYYLDMSSEFAKAIGDNWLLSDNLNVLTRILMDQKNYNAALRTSKEAESLANELNSNVLIVDILSWQHQVLYKLNKDKEAYEVLLRHTNYKDSLYSNEMVKKVSEVEEVMNSKIETIFAEQKLLDEKRKTFRSNQLIALGIILILILLLLMVRYFSKRNISEKFTDYIILIAVLLFFRFVYLYFDPYALSFTENSTLLKIIWSILVALIIAPISNFLHRIAKSKLTVQVK